MGKAAWEIINTQRKLKNTNERTNLDFNTFNNFFAEIAEQLVVGQSHL